MSFPLQIIFYDFLQPMKWFCNFYCDSVTLHQICICPKKPFDKAKKCWLQKIPQQLCHYDPPFVAHSKMERYYVFLLCYRSFVIQYLVRQNFQYWLDLFPILNYTRVIAGRRPTLVNGHIMGTIWPGFFFLHQSSMVYSRRFFLLWQWYWV